MTKIKYEGVAVITMNSDNRILSKSVIQTETSDQAIELARAISNVPQTNAMPVYREFDAFGRAFWVNNSRADHLYRD